MTKIHRHTGTPIAGTPYAFGAGYKGLTPELDAVVARAAELLEVAFNSDIEIRFNTDRRSGGAWLVDGIGNAGVGLTAGLKPVRPAGLTDQEWWDWSIEVERALPHVIQVATFVAKDRLRDPAVANQGNLDSRYASHEHDGLEAGLAWLQEVAS